MTDEVRKWEDKPYGPTDSKIFSIFERDLMDDLQAAKGFRQVLWNSPSDASTASWLSKVIYVEKDAADILKESEANADEENENEKSETIEITKKSYCEELTMKFYGHKLRDFGVNKIKLWQKVNNVKHLIETESLRCMISYENELKVAY